MKKRILMVLMVCVLAASFIYADNTVVFATVSPFQLQKVDSNWGTSFTSRYGWGAKAGIRKFTGPVLLGLDLGYNGFIYSANDYALTTMQLLAKVGGKAVLSDTADLNGDIGFGVEMDYYKNVFSFYPVVAGSISFSKYVKPDTAVVFGVDSSLTWPKSEDSSFKSYVWDFGFIVGVEFDF